MKTLIVYYSYTGKTELVAQAIARILNADLRKVEDLKERSKFGAYLCGSLSAALKKSGKIKPVELGFEGYSRIFVGSPVWAGNPVPAINAFIAAADFTGKTAVPFATMGGSSSGTAIEQMYAALRAKGATVNSSFSIPTGGQSDNNLISAAEKTARQYLMMKL